MTIVFVAILGVVAILAAGAVEYMLPKQNSLGAGLIVRAVPLVAAVLVAGVVMAVGWIIRKRGVRRWQWDDDMMKVQALASAVMAFGCSWFVLWLPMMWVLPQRFLGGGRPAEHEKELTLKAMAIVPSAIIAFIAYWCAKRYYAASTAGGDEAGRKARKAARRVIGSIAGAAVLLLAFLTFWYRGDVGVFLIALFAVSPAILLVVTGLLVIAAGWARASMGVKTCGKWYLALSLIWVSISLSYPAGWLLTEWQVNQAKSYCEKLAVRLDEYKKLNGAYPADIWVVSDDGRLPYMLRHQSTPFYYLGEDYQLSIWDPRGMMTQHIYDHKRRVWVRD